MKKIDYIPKDSHLHLWLEGGALSRAPVSFKILSAMFSAGAVARGNVWVDFRGQKTIPGFSVLFLGEGRNNAMSSVLSLVMDTDPHLLAGAPTLEGTKAVLGPKYYVVLVNMLERFIGGADSVPNLLEVLQSEDPVVFMAASDVGFSTVNALLEDTVLVVHENDAPSVVLPYTEDEFRRVESARLKFKDEIAKVRRVEGKMELSVPAEEILQGGPILAVKLSAVSALLRGSKCIDPEDATFACKLVEYARKTTRDRKESCR